MSFLLCVVCVCLSERDRRRVCERKRESQSVCAGVRVHYCELITSVTKQQMHHFFITEGTGHLRTRLVTQVEEIKTKM